LRTVTALEQRLAALEASLARLQREPDHG
jgi:uncharacterized small protein (DUF1192 family)